MEQAHASPIASKAIERIGQLYRIESGIRGRLPDERREIRKVGARPVLDSLHSGWKRPWPSCRESWTPQRRSVVATKFSAGESLGAVAPGRLDIFDSFGAVSIAFAQVAATTPQSPVSTVSVT